MATGAGSIACQSCSGWVNGCGCGERASLHVVDRNDKGETQYSLPEVTVVMSCKHDGMTANMCQTKVWLSIQWPTPWEHKVHTDKCAGTGRWSAAAIASFAVMQQSRCMSHVAMRMLCICRVPRIVHMQSVSHCMCASQVAKTGACRGASLVCLLVSAGYFDGSAGNVCKTWWIPAGDV